MMKLGERLREGLAGVSGGRTGRRASGPGSPAICSPNAFQRRNPVPTDPRLFRGSCLTAPRPRGDNRALLHS